MESASPFLHITPSITRDFLPSPPPFSLLPSPTTTAPKNTASLTPAPLVPPTPTSPILLTSPTLPTPISPPPIQSGSHEMELEGAWKRLLRNWDSSRKHKESQIKVLCRKGIPQSLRGQVWSKLTGSDIRASSQPSLYPTLVLTSDTTLPPPLIFDIIERDIHRCYPSHSLFRDSNSLGQSNLRQVLRAYALYNPNVGYCQGMGFLVGLMLMYLPPEGSFWLLVETLERFLTGYFTPSMVRLRVDAQIFHGLIKEVVSKRLSKHLDSQGVEPLLYMTSWFLTMFTTSLPWGLVLRIWDIFYFEGIKILYRVGLGILKISKVTLLESCPGTGEIMEYLLSLPPNILSPDSLFKICFDIKLKRREITKLEKKAKKEFPALEKEAKDLEIFRLQQRKGEIIPNKI